ncbi:MAG: 5,6-dimethylbenzimidazole synthase [Mycobacteriales bacterium]
MSWRRPVPLVGDTTSARARSADPRGWAFPAADREVLQAVIAARRDVRRYRPDPVPETVMFRVLEAAHRAPSVGHSQPWRFLVVTDAQLRERAALMADRERLRQAAGMDPESGRHLLDLQLEGIREAPLGVVVCCDRRVPAAGVLGRATFPDTDLWSCACAIENLWLAARAEGLGLGWVTLFQPEELAELLALPPGVVTLGWLCLGWPDERPPAPGLERAGWSRRTPLAEVVLRERWPADPAAVPAAPRSRLRAPEAPAVIAGRDQADELLTSPGSLGLLDRAVDRVVAASRAAGTDRPRELPRSARLLFVGADHPVTAHGVSAYPADLTGEVLRAAAAGEAMGAAAARSAGLDLVVVDATSASRPVEGALDARPSKPQGDLVTTAALSRSDADRLFAVGQRLGEAASREVGLLALGEVGIGNTTVAAALSAALLDLPVSEVVGLGAGSDSAILVRKREVVASALGRVATRTRDPLTLLAELGGPEIAVLAGAVLGVAAGRGVVVLDGLATGVAALIAVRVEPAAAQFLVAGQRSREAAHPAVLEALGLEPLLDLRLRAGEGVGAVLATSLLLQALAVRRLAGRTR